MGIAAGQFKESATDPSAGISGWSGWLVKKCYTVCSGWKLSEKCVLESMMCVL